MTKNKLSITVLFICQLICFGGQDPAMHSKAVLTCSKEQDGLEHLIFLPWPPACWGHKQLRAYAAVPSLAVLLCDVFLLLLVSCAILSYCYFFPSKTELAPMSIYYLNNLPFVITVTFANCAFGLGRNWMISIDPLCQDQKKKEAKHFLHASNSYIPSEVFLTSCSILFSIPFHISLLEYSVLCIHF